MGELDGEVCWQEPGLSRVSWRSGYTQGCIFPGVRVRFPTQEKVALELTAIFRFLAFLKSSFEVILDRNQVQPHSFGLSWSQDRNRAEPETGP